MRFGSRKHLGEFRWRRSVSEKLAYLAGLIDGEGCIYINEKSGLSLSVTNSDPTPLLFFKEFFVCGAVFKVSPKVNLTVWRWNITGESARSILRAVLPFLIIKQEQARAALNPVEGTIEYLKRLKRIDYEELPTETYIY